MSKKKEKLFGGKFTTEIIEKNRDIFKKAKIFAWIVGVIGLLLLGTGMSISLVNADKAVLLVIGSLISIPGIILMVLNDYLRKTIITKLIVKRDTQITVDTEINNASVDDVIKVKNLTKSYGHGRGVFDVSFSVRKGEVFGFLGPNGAGKSTTMRHLMGFSKPQGGNCYINGKNCWSDHARIMQNVGYLPGEVALPDGVSGKGFLSMMRGLRKSEIDRTEELLETFQVNCDGPVKRMSIGEKRKLAVAAAFMSDPEVLLLDEPTSGLDPVMQEKFIEFVLGEKEKGKTVLLSSHIFSEVEALCDRIAIIKDGKIVSVVTAEEVKHYKRKTFVVSFADKDNYDKFVREKFDFRVKNDEKLTVEIAVDDSQADAMIKTLVKYKVTNLVEHQQTLEEYFMNFYKSERTFGGL